ncbi:Magnesium transporter [Musa troglodytarum]|uniref:Magnesium transporter n=1 Tax=Musa troglodytarum TaxID=320322 RepID=A0A9E7KZG6_9LILI|nr:Magnesium transporter [Musa troglodytarum]
MVAANMKAETISLMEMREAMEAEMNAIIESLCGAGGSRLSGNLVDSEVPMSLPKPQARHRSRRTPTGSPFFFYLGPTSTFRLFDRNAIGSVLNLNFATSHMSVSLSENTSQDSSTAEEAVSRIPFAIIDEIDGDSPAAEDGLQLSDEIVKSGNVEKCENLQSRLMAEAQSNQGNLIPLEQMELWKRDARENKSTFGGASPDQISRRTHQSRRRRRHTRSAAAVGA